MAAKCSKRVRDSYFKEIIRKPARISICEVSGSSPTRDLTNPIYKKFARISGRINQMDDETLKFQLKSLGLANDGTTISLQRRLKNFIKTEMQEKIENKP